MTELLLQDGTTKELNDTWTDQTTANTTLRDSWTGRTVFFKTSATNMLLVGAVLASMVPNATSAHVG